MSCSKELYEFLDYEAYERQADAILEKRDPK